MKGVALQPEPVLGPEIARATASAIWALNRLHGNPLQIPQIMDTAASKQLRTGTCKLQPPSVPSSLFRAQKLHERRDLRAQNMSEAI